MAQQQKQFEIAQAAAAKAQAAQLQAMKEQQAAALKAQQEAQAAAALEAEKAANRARSFDAASESGVVRKSEQKKKTKKAKRRGTSALINPLTAGAKATLGIQGGLSSGGLTIAQIKKP